MKIEQVRVRKLLELARREQEEVLERSRPFSITRDIQERRGMAAILDPWRRRDEVERMFPRLVSMVRDSFILDVRFSRVQWKMFQDWVHRHGVPMNLHFVRKEEMTGTIRGPDGPIYTSYFVVRLMDIKWMWEL